MCLLCMLEAVEAELCLLTALDVLEVTRYVLFCMPEGLEVLRGDAPCAALYAAGGRGGELCLLTALEVAEVMRCALLCMLEVVEGGFYLLEVLEVLEVLRGDAP